MALLRLLLAAAQLLLSMNASNAQPSVSPEPAGPFTSLTMLFNAAAVVSQSLPSALSNARNVSPPSEEQPTLPDVNGHAAMTLFSQLAFAWHDAPPITFEPNFGMHSSTPSNGVVVWLEVTVVVAVVVVVGVDEPEVVCEDVSVVVVVGVVDSVVVCELVAVVVAVVLWLDVPVVVCEDVWVVVCEDDTVVVALVVCEDVGVVVVVGVVVRDDVTELVTVDVTVDVGVVVVVGVVVAVVVCDVVGVVTSQSWNPPASNASAIAFKEAAAASQSLESNRNPKAHPTLSASPSGPRNSVNAAFRALTVVEHASPSNRPA